MSAALELSGVVAGYGDVVVLRGVDLHVAEGEVVALLGPNGAGKTTSLLTVSGLLKLKEGSVRVGGSDTAGLGPTKVARLGVAHVPEDRSLFTQLSVAENLRLGAGSLRADISDAVRYFPELEKLQSRQAGLLSGGEQQMLAVGRALLQRPRLLLVDEMSLGLAPVVVQRLLPILRDVARDTGAGVLFVEQHVELALQVADRAYVLNRGAVSLEGSAEELRSSRELIASSYIGAEVLEEVL